MLPNLSRHRHHAPPIRLRRMALYKSVFDLIYYFRPTLPRYRCAKYCDQRVCLSVCPLASKTTRTNFTKSSVAYMLRPICGCGSILGVIHFIYVLRSDCAVDITLLFVWVYCSIVRRCVSADDCYVLHVLLYHDARTATGQDQPVPCARREI